MSAFNPIIFIGLEKINVNHQMNIAKAKKMEFYSFKEKQPRLDYKYKEILIEIDTLKSRSKEIGKET